MSKMSELAMELDDQAVELGYESYEHALAVGYEVDYKNHRLVKPVDSLLDQAHKEWLEERDELLEQIEACINLDQKGWGNIQNTLIKARDFIKRGEV